MKALLAAMALAAAVAATPACTAPATELPGTASAPLIIKTGTGLLRFEPRNVRDGVCTNDDCVDFRRAPAAPPGYALVHKIHYEGSEWLLIDTASGAQQAFPAEPHFSPDQSRVIAINPDEMGDGAQSGSFVYQRGADGLFAEVARFPMPDFVPKAFAGWQSADCASIAGFTGWGQPGFDTGAETGASIARAPTGAWSLSPRPCPATD